MDSKAETEDQKEDTRDRRFFWINYSKAETEDQKEDTRDRRFFWVNYSKAKTEDQEKRYQRQKVLLDQL